MHQPPTRYANSRIMTDEDRQPNQRKILALDALSKLTQRFSKKPDFQELINILLMTLSGQFSVADSFALLHRPSPHSLSPSFFATGKLRKIRILASTRITPDHCQYFVENRSVRKATELKLPGESAKLGLILVQCGVNLVCPLVHSDRFFGIIGIGERVNKKPYQPEDIDLLITITNTITPFVANSYLFWEIASLNTWYLDILNTVKQGVFVFDNDNRLKKINSAGLNILKAFEPHTPDVDSLFQAPVPVVFPCEVFGHWARQSVEAKRTNQIPLLKSIVARTKKTERIYNVSLSESSENPETGKDLIITLDDVTAQKQIEQRLFDLQKLADKGLMASSISHELNNFLGLILGGLEVTQMALARGDGVKANASLDKLKAHVSNMERFIVGLMDYGKLKTTRQSANLNSIVADVLSFVSVQKRFKRIVINSELDPNILEFSMDADQIAQLLLNLLNNAADAIHELNAEEGRISVRTAFEKGNALLFISDNGIGIKPEVKETLFKSRFTTKAKGHGCGLVTSAKIIEGHEGTIEVDTQVGRGTTFAIRFPVPLRA